MGKIIWSDQAKKEVKSIVSYYRKVAPKHIADEIKKGILNAPKHSIDFNKIGAIDEDLEFLEDEFRYCRYSHYRIIYAIVKEGVLITDVFDARQNPTKKVKRYK